LLRGDGPGLLRTAAISAALVALSPLTLAMYGPSMPAMVAAFDTTQGRVQLTLTVYLVAFALAQLVYGPLADRFGRRAVALGGLLLYLAGCLVAYFAGSIEMMLAARILEGVGACGGSASSRAFVRDLYRDAAAARVFSLVGLALALAPAFGAVAAGYLQQEHGWQAIFVLLGAVAALLLLFIWSAMPETLAPPERIAIRAATMLPAYGRVLIERGFLGPALLLALAGAGTYYYVAVAPFVLIQQLGVEPARFGRLMLLLMAAYLAASGLSALLVGRIGPAGVVWLGVAAGLLASLLLFLGLQFGAAGIEAVVGCLMLWMAGIALITPGVTMAALAPFDRHRGSAAAILGFLQMLGSGLGSLVAALAEGGLLGLAPVPLLALGALLHRLLLPRDRLTSLPA